MANTYVIDFARAGRVEVEQRPIYPGIYNRLEAERTARAMFESGGYDWVVAWLGSEMVARIF